MHKLLTLPHSLALVGTPHNVFINAPAVASAVVFPRYHLALNLFPWLLETIKKRPKG
jgi:hypothetical protein